MTDVIVTTFDAFVRVIEPLPTVGWALIIEAATLIGVALCGVIIWTVFTVLL